MEAEPDFSGYATKANLKCSDGRTITPEAFKDQDKTKVPLVWQHAHNEPTNVLGHAVLENRKDGVYCYGYFNDTDTGQSAKKLVVHDDINALSIYANRLVEKGKNVIHGVIREVSLVLAGANPGALIDYVNLQHSDGTVEELEDEAIIYTGLSLEHENLELEVKSTEESVKTEEVNEENKPDEQVSDSETTEDEIEHAEKTVQDVFDTLNEEQKKVVFFLVGEAMKGGNSSSTAEHADNAAAYLKITPVFNDKGFITSQKIEVIDPNLEQSDLDDAFSLKHFGKKGMKWGVRNDKGHEGENAKTRTIAKADKQYAKSFTGVKGFVTIQNHVADHINSRIGGLNDKYANKDVSVEGSKDRNAYLKEYEKLVEDATVSATNAIGVNASGTRRIKVTRTGSGVNTYWQGTWEEVKHADAEINEMMHSLTDEQKDVVFFMIGEALEHGKQNSTELADDSAAHNDTKEGNNTMTHNVFESDAANDNKASKGKTLSHEDTKAIFKAAQRGGSLRAAVEDYAGDTLEHGIQDIDVLFPDARSVTTTPEFIQRRNEWVADVMTGTRHTPFARIKSMTADLTVDEARAKGYIKGHLKKEEFFRVARRETLPQTVYKKQKLDRDDILDITDFDVVIWLKGEMRLMLEEEIARAVLVGDGRDPSSEDKIMEDHIRPIATDNDLFVSRLYVNLDDANSSAEEIVSALVLNRRFYRGSGNPALYTSETVLAQLLSVKDTVGRRIYTTVNDLLAVLRVSKIVPVEVLDEINSTAVAIMVNLNDYTIGSDRGGDVALFDDFDIDYNQYKYLIETRISGALVKPKSALVVLKVASTATLVTPVAPAWNGTTHQVTVATTTGITYKNRATGATLVTGTPITLSVGDELIVIAVPNSGYYLATNEDDEFRFTYADGRLDPPF